MKTGKVLTMIKWAAVFALVCMLSLPAAGKTVRAAGDIYDVNVATSYLALRNARAYDRSNEIGELYNGDYVEVTDRSDPTYWYVYSPKYNTYGYVNKNYLVARTSSVSSSSSNTWTVSVAKGYLALRTAKAYDASNEIGELYSGDTVQVQSMESGDYWYVYAPSLGKYGYVNKNYLVGGSGASVGGSSWTVSVAKGYLALRTAKAYDASNEIGELYSGDTVQVQSMESGDYWYVYAPSLGKYGYVNKNYLVGGSGTSVGGSSWTVSVSKGYLALRTAKAYDSSNEIGELYSGDTVQVQSMDSGDYWYVYAPSLGKYGYVNKNYLIGGSSSAPAPSSGSTWTVRVSKGYLALRTAKAYDTSNEIGELYTGDTVQVQSMDSGDYWYVYAPTLGKYGYVNKNYLY